MATTKQFKKEDIKAGYAIRFRCGEVRVIMPAGEKGTLIAVNFEGYWDYLSCWDDELKTRKNNLGIPLVNRTPETDIVEVYGYVHGTDRYKLMFCGDNIQHRPLLWKRNEAKKMTVSEINAALGYEVEIVAEKED